MAATQRIRADDATAEAERANQRAMAVIDDARKIHDSELPSDGAR